jgi:hypothetical protein
MGTIIVDFVLLIFIGLAIGAMLIVWLWRKKSAEDRDAFSEVLKQESVTTYYNPEEYAKASRARSQDETE